MARKSFLDNPAMQFITVNDGDAERNLEKASGTAPEARPMIDAGSKRSKNENLAAREPKENNLVTQMDKYAAEDTHMRGDALTQPQVQTHTEMADDAHADAHTPKPIESHHNTYEPAPMDTEQHKAAWMQENTDQDAPGDTFTRQHTYSNQNTYNDGDTGTYTHTSTVSATSPVFLPRRESKSKRLQLLIKPSTHAQIQRIARAHETSVNDAVNAILEDYIRKGL